MNVTNHSIRRALVTGAGDGIGFALANAMLAKGYSVILVSRNFDRWKGRESDKLRFVKADLSSSSWEEIFQREVDFSSLDVCVNNAGANHHGEFEDLDSCEVDRLIFLNFATPAKISLHYLKNRKTDGILVNVTSITARIPLPGASIYSSSKAALSRLSFYLKKELGSRDFKVIDFCPAAVCSQFHRKAASKSSIPKFFSISPEIAAFRLLEKIESGYSGAYYPDLLSKLFGFFSISPLAILTRIIFR